MPRTMTRPASPRTGWRALPLYVLAGVVGVALLAAVALQLQGPSRADLTVSNDTRWDVSVQIIHEDGALRPLATLRPGTTRTVSSVLVPGDVWRFRWTIEGSEMHESRVEHDDLRSADFEIAVPDEVVAAAEASAIRPPR